MKKIYYKPNLDIISFNSQDTTSVTNISAVTNRMTKAKTVTVIDMDEGFIFPIHYSEQITSLFVACFASHRIYLSDSLFKKEIGLNFTYLFFRKKGQI